MGDTDLHRITGDSFIEFVEFHPVLESTNVLAFELRDELIRRAPALVLTDEQTAGRGRGANSWWSTGGALTCSVVLDAERHGPSPEKCSLVALATGLAVRELVAELITNRDVETKWPNDVLVNDHKICGILTEQHTTDSGNVLIIGIGLNVNNSLTSAPYDVQQRGTSVFDMTGVSHDLTDVLCRLLCHLESCLKALRTNSTTLVQRFADCHRLTGSQVTVDTPQGILEGICIGIAPNGSLQLETAAGAHEILAGSVMEFE